MKLQEGDVAVVTGAASGIGFALAERFASVGMRVVAADVEPGALDTAVARLGDRFWLLTHADWMPMAVARWDSIAEGVDPAPVEEIPGMPPRSQLIEEALAALAAQGEG